MTHKKQVSQMSCFQENQSFGTSWEPEKIAEFLPQITKKDPKGVGKITYFPQVVGVRLIHHEKNGLLPPGKLRWLAGKGTL